MKKDSTYYRQVQLLVRVLPLLDSEKCFALKGGTAINLCYRELPRLLVDIDLLYLPSEARMEVCETVEREFGYAEIQVASLPDLYAGKIAAALDRQHPRDLFDVKFLLENEGFTEDLRKTFLVFLISHQRPMAELLAPHRKEIREIYEAEFAQMAEVDIPVEELEQTREQLIAIINKEMTAVERKFLLSFKERNPQWELLGLSNMEEVSNLPSVQ